MGTPERARGKVDWCEPLVCRSIHVGGVCEPVANDYASKKPRLVSVENSGSSEPVRVGRPAETSRSATGAQTKQTFYMYRAQSEAEYPMENVNTGDLPGVLWYLHNEIVTMCPRKYGVIRIKRLRITVQNDLALTSPWFYSPYVAFDRGKCTVPGCTSIWKQKGFAVGCQPR